jgi:hypothetical protein
MRTIARSLAGTIAGILLLAPVAASADPAARCTHDAWNVGGQPLSATLCVPASGSASAHVTVTATYARAGASLTRTLDLDLENGTDVTRDIDTVPLDTLGSPLQLRVTVAYRNGAASIEHALLLPGAVVLK